MAGKKGQAVQLQQEITSDEEWEKLMEKEGLIVVDIYSEWCGPCSGMQGTLKKVKLEVGGDSLHLAVAKSDNIKCLERFKGKSEPTWMFISGGKMVNLMFGAHAPKLTRLIMEELKKEELSRAGTPRTDVKEVDELADEEQERYDVIFAAEMEARRIEEEKRAQALLEQRTAQANYILETYAHLGTVLILPKGKDRYMEVLGDLWSDAGFNTGNKDKVRVTEAMLEELLYFADWDFPEQTLENILAEDSLAIIIKPGSDEMNERMDQALVEFIYGPSKCPPGSPDSPAQKLMYTGEEEQEGQEEGEEGKEEIEIMGIWCPPNSMTKAYALKSFFPNMVASLILPEPEPTPPHLVIAYDAYRRKEILEVMNQYQQDVMRYGFFTSENPKNAQLVAKTIPKFEKALAESTTHTEKLIIQLSKKRSEAFLAFAQLNPCYMSPNVKVGEQECKMFFPEDYDEPPEEIVEEEEEPKKKGKKKAKKSSTSLQDEAAKAEGEEGELAPVAEEGEEGAEAEGEEGTVVEGEEGAAAEGEQASQAQEGEGEAPSEAGLAEEDKATSPMTDEGAGEEPPAAEA